MELPLSISEAEFLAAAAHVSKILYSRLGKVVGTAEDFAQQVVVWSLESLPRYQAGRPIEGYLLTNARNRALNYYRDHVSRLDPPCRACHEGTPCSDGDFCKRHMNWLERNRAKSNIARPAGIEVVMGLTKPSAVEPEVVGNELSLLIDQQLSIALRADYLRLLAGEPVPKPRREKVQQAVRDILQNPGRTTQPSSAPPDKPDDLFDLDDEDESR